MDGHRTKSELAVQILRERIRTGELAPGTRLRMDDLKVELGMSPTPIREALRLLQADHLVDYQPHQGIVVAAGSPFELDEVLQLRVLLEPQAVEAAFRHLTPEDVAMLEDVHAQYLESADAGDGTMLNTLNAEWHMLLYERSGSPLLVEFVERLWQNYPWRTAYAIPGLIESSRRQHDEMMETIRAGDAERTATLMREHIEGSRPFIVERLAVDAPGVVAEPA